MTSSSEIWSNSTSIVFLNSSDIYLTLVITHFYSWKMNAHIWIILLILILFIIQYFLKCFMFIAIHQFWLIYCILCLFCRDFCVVWLFKLQCLISYETRDFIHRIHQWVSWISERRERTFFNDFSRHVNSQ